MAVPKGSTDIISDIPIILSYFNEFVGRRISVRRCRDERGGSVGTARCRRVSEMLSHSSFGGQQVLLQHSSIDSCSFWVLLSVSVSPLMLISFNRSYIYRQPLSPLPTLSTIALPRHPSGPVLLSSYSRRIVLVLNDLLQLLFKMCRLYRRLGKL